MPLDGNGGYNPPSPENPVRAGTLIKSEDFNTTIDDIADALSTAVYKDGQAVMEADLDMGHHSLLRVKAVRNDEPMTISTTSTLTIQAGGDTTQTIAGNTTYTIGGEANTTIAGDFNLSAENIEITTGDINLTADSVNTTISELSAPNADATLHSITLLDGRQVQRHTQFGGTGRAYQSIITTEQGLIDISLLPLVSTPTDSIYLRTTTALQKGDFVGIVGIREVAAVASNSTIFAIGFVLEDYELGSNALVHLAGFNNQVVISGIATMERAVYIDTSGGSSRTLSYTPIPGYFIGYAVSNNTIHFWGGGVTNSVSNAKLYFFGG